MASKLDRITIDGKPGTVAYLDRDGTLTTADRAASAKVVFEDGSHLWLQADRVESRPLPDAQRRPLT